MVKTTEGGPIGWHEGQVCLLWVPCETFDRVEIPIIKVCHVRRSNPEYSSLLTYISPIFARTHLGGVEWSNLSAVVCTHPKIIGNFNSVDLEDFVQNKKNILKPLV